MTLEPPDADADARARFRRVRAVFEAASAREEEDRPAFVARECGDDVALGEEVAAMLSADRDQGSVLDQPLEGSAAALFEARQAVAGGTTFGAFRVLRRIGAGGMGTVYLAERSDGAFEQRVAIKVFAASPRLESRFRREQAILARLDHPRIARLMDAGVHEGRQPYFVLEYVEGQPLDAYLRAHAPSYRERVALVIEICEAVAYAHRNLVVHRDLKPENVLVTPDGHVKLLDFGIAKLLADADTLATHTLQGAATPAYAAPEQLTGGAITTATDVWALGVLLYQVLSGALPFPTGSGRMALEHAILHTDPARPSSLVPSIPEDLEAIALASLRREPDLRIPSVDAFADDLRRWLSRRPVHARGASRRYRAVRFVQRNRLALALTALASAAIFGGVAAALWQARAARVASASAIAEAGRAKLAKDFLVRLFFNANPSSGRTEGDQSARGMLERAEESLRKGELSASPDVQADLLELIAWLHGQRGERDSEIAAMQSAIAVWSRIRPPEHPDLLASRGMLTYALTTASRLGEADAECREILPLANRAGTPARPRSIILRVCGRLAGTEGRFDEATRDLRVAVAPARESEDRSYAALVGAELASALVMTGDYDGAHAAALEALRDLDASADLVTVALDRAAATKPGAFEKRSGAASAPDLIRAGGVTAMVATVETTRGNDSEAEAVLAKTLPRVSLALGKDHPLAVALRRRRALVWGRTGRNADALAELEALAALPPAGNRREQILIRVALAEVLLRAGQIARAERIAADAIPDLDRVVPENHLDRAELRGLLAQAVAARGDHDGARRLLEEAVRPLAPAHPFRKEVASRLSSL